MGRNAFLQSLKEHIESAQTGITQLYPTIPNGVSERAGTAEETLSILLVNLDGKTLRSFNDTIMIGSITTTKNVPYIILQSYNFDILFSGMLTWEPTLYFDFAPIFGTSNVQGKKFVDAVRDNKPVRVLRDDTGNELLVYSLIDQNTVVITASQDALSEIIKKL